MPTPLLTLKDIGKIYVSEGNVAVGIRGVNLSFDRGEFVAVTGKSGSGKSTLLNVISGMDSYEEGELCIEGQTTSHYLQPEWEEYREKYISFIFQDYNIIESFTVLQNVELALMHIADKKERRARALSLLERVGLSSHVKQKGSKLSGGQKQRTVIARALAKDSPIILADEPTGNLDSATSREIIELLCEVSRDKLLIVVTHNFEQVQSCATRHIRIFDGAVESDHTLCPARATTAAEDSPAQTPAATISRREKKRAERRQQLRNGWTLGCSIFTAKPRLSSFLCFLMLLGTLGIFMMTTLCGSAAELFEPYYMFEHIEGRVVLTTQSGEVIPEETLAALAKEYGATEYLHYDVLLDQRNMLYATLPVGESVRDYEYVALQCTYGEDFGDNIIGRYPVSADEVLLWLPISYQPVMGKDALQVDTILLNSMNLKVCGVKYYYDNNLSPKCLFTEEGFRTATAEHYLFNFSDSNITVRLTNQRTGAVEEIYIWGFVPAFDMAEDKVHLSSRSVDNVLKQWSKDQVDISIDFRATYRNYNYSSWEGPKTMTFTHSFDKDDLTEQKPDWNGFYEYSEEDDRLYISDELLRQIAEQVLERSYRQASLFFESDREAHKAARGLQDAGYIAVPSDTTYQPDALEAIVNLLAGLTVAMIWLVSIVFLAFFINLCSSRALSAFKGDMAIMRSMGIGVQTIRIGMYVRMLISLIPAFVVMVATAVLIFTTPAFNKYFVYLYGWQYALIFFGMLLLTVRTTHKQIRRLFRESVKKALKGGAAE